VTFTVNSLTRCPGQNHYHLTVTAGGGGTFTLDFVRADLATDPAEHPDAVLVRLRSAVKEAGATTWAQVQAAVVGKTFQV